MFIMNDCHPKKKKKQNSDVDLDSDAEAPDFRAPLNVDRAGSSSQGPPSSAPPLEAPSPRVGGKVGQRYANVLLRLSFVFVCSEASQIRIQ